jgi:Heterokaryon incompatibility protein (HET)
MVKFLRSGSYLTQSTTEPPIFSLIVGPGITAAPNDLQRSFPRLPRVVTEPGREAKSTPKPEPKLTITGQEAKFTVMKKWIADCDKKHTKEDKDQPNCNPERQGIRLPTRLIYVGNKNDKNLRLNCEETRDPALKYIALSHRWGYPKDDKEWLNPDGSTNDFCTTDSTIEEFKRGIKFESMPKTFRDAVEVTRGLGIEYLWIDSLCIIQHQEKKEDFNIESHRMRDVYSGAYCTIASTCARGTTDGFLSKSEDRLCVRIDTKRRVFGGDKGSTVNKDCTVYICDAIDDFQNDVDKAEMGTRGWIFQERALSRRTLYFGKKQVYWECGAGICCETMTRMFK